MLEQEVAFVRSPASLLARVDGLRPFLLDGGDGRSWGDGTVRCAANPVATLEIRAERAGAPLDELAHFARRHLDDGCVAIGVVLSYDLKHWIERLDRRHPWPAQPLVYAAAFDRAYAADRSTGRARLVGRNGGALAAVARTFGAADDVPVRALPGAALEAAMSRDDYVAMVERAVEYIAAGDIYQANLAHCFRAAFEPNLAAALFAEWNGRFPAPYAAYVAGGDWALVSNSPECLLDVRGADVATYPIKGTRSLAGCAAAAELAADPKERAEHVMIVDLERNDLGRICVPGSVRVVAMQEIRRFPMLLHMVSEVRGRLRGGVGLADILRATFPGGSITGAPKVRAMQIIEELEPLPRGFYTGSIGWIEPGWSRFNIAIRTAVVDAGGLSFHVGGGIVADSDPEREYAETLTKAGSLFRVLSEPRETRDLGKKECTP